MPKHALEEDEPEAVIYGSGYRFHVAARLLRARGKPGVIERPGGMSPWLEAG